MTVLGFDTSTPATSVCVLRDDGEAFAEDPEPAALAAPPAHARELMPAIVRVLERAGAGFGDLRSIAVGVGPGTFTGLRIGIATARGLAEARGLPVHPVSSLAALAAGVDAPLVLALIDARRRQVFASLHADGEVVWPPEVTEPAALAERLRSERLRPLAAGDGSVRFREPLEAAGAEVPPDDSPLHVVRALHVCRLAARVPATTPEAVVPDYLRVPDATPPR